jgi:cytochrome b pre-mRNA-processing protein 3
MWDKVRSLFRKADDAGEWQPFYDQIVREVRSPDWYRRGGVTDAVEGRFELLCLILSLAMRRLAREGETGRVPQVRLAELFVADMESQMRQEGMGDSGLAKQMGKLMSSFGGRLEAYGLGLDAGQAAEPLTRNLYRGEKPGDQSLAWVLARIGAIEAGLTTCPFTELKQGAWPK